MICSSCRRQLVSSLASSTKANGIVLPSTTSTASSALSLRMKSAQSPRISRPFHTTRSEQSSAPTAPKSSSSPAVTQPLSSPEAGVQASSTPSPNEPPATKVMAPISSVAGGTPLRGLGYLKNNTNPLAKEDDEYPEWLWGLLDESRIGKAGIDAETGLEKVNMNEMTKKQRAKHMKKRQQILANLPKVIPVHEQSINLTSENASPLEHLEKRKELVKSGREARRKGIRERNYLGGM